MSSFGGFSEQCLKDQLREGLPCTVFGCFHEDVPELIHAVLNVVEQVTNVVQTTIVQDAWERGQELTVHGWVYGLKDGKLHDLGMTVSKLEDLAPNTARRMELYAEADKAA